VGEKKIPYFDAHCDTVTRPGSLLADSEHHLDLRRLSAYGPAAQLLAIFAPPGRDSGADFPPLLARARREIEAAGTLVRLCRTAEEISAAARESRIALLLGVEGANLLDCGEEGLLAAYEDGVRLVTLCWNQDNILCGSAMDSGAGLREAGRRFVRACGRLGVAVDLSHASEQTFFDVLEQSHRPVICSHSDAKALCGHPRNLTDDQLRALVADNGFVGINLYPEFLGLGADMDAIIAHIEHFLALGAEKNLGLGTDFDGIETTPRGVAGVEDMAKLYEALLRRGLEETLVEDIFYNNLFRYWERVL